jgi:hypothetical protein
MSAHSRFTALREVVRAAARAAEGESTLSLGLDRLCATARMRGVPERLLRPFLVIAARHWSDETLPLTLSRQLAVGNGTAEANARLLTLLAERVGLSGESTSDALLLGDAALLAGLYGTLGAFPLRLPLAATASATDAGTGLPLYLRARGGVLGIVPLGPLAELVRNNSRRWSDGTHTWRVPRRELMLTLLAARLGDPLAHPDPPLWHHLALLLQLWPEAEGREMVLEHAARLGLLSQVGRGLAVLGHLFPELQSWAGSGRIQLSLLARSLAVPLAARALVGAAFEEEPAPPAEEPPARLAQAAWPARSW